MSSSAGTSSVKKSSGLSVAANVQVLTLMWPVTKPIRLQLSRDDDNLTPHWSKDDAGNLIFHDVVRDEPSDDSSSESEFSSEEVSSDESDIFVALPPCKKKKQHSDEQLPSSEGEPEGDRGPARLYSEAIAKSIGNDPEPSNAVETGKPKEKEEMLFLENEHSYSDTLETAVISSAPVKQEVVDTVPPPSPSLRSTSRKKAKSTTRELENVTKLKFGILECTVPLVRCDPKTTSAVNLKRPNKVRRNQKTTISKAPQATKKRYPCMTCRKTFYSKEYVAVHNSIHAKEKPYKCTDCHQRFRQYPNLYMHVRRRHGRKPYKEELTRLKPELAPQSEGEQRTRTRRAQPRRLRATPGPKRRRKKSIAAKKDDFTQAPSQGQEEDFPHLPPSAQLGILSWDEICAMSRQMNPPAPTNHQPLKVQDPVTLVERVDASDRTPEVVTTENEQPDDSSTSVIFDPVEVREVLDEMLYTVSAEDNLFQQLEVENPAETSIGNAEWEALNYPENLEFFDCDSTKSLREFLDDTCPLNLKETENGQFTDILGDGNQNDVGWDICDLPSLERMGSTRFTVSAIDGHDIEKGYLDDEQNMEQTADTLTPLGAKDILDNGNNFGDNLGNEHYKETVGNEVETDRVFLEAVKALESEVDVEDSTHESENCVQMHPEAVYTLLESNSSDVSVFPKVDSSETMKATKEVAETVELLLETLETLENTAAYEKGRALEAEKSLETLTGIKRTLESNSSEASVSLEDESVGSMDNMTNEVAETMEALLETLETLENNAAKEIGKTLEAEKSLESHSDTAAVGNISDSDELSVQIDFDAVISSVIQQALDTLDEVPVIRKNKSRRAKTLKHVEVEKVTITESKPLELSEKSSDVLVALDNVSSETLQTLENGSPDIPRAVETFKILDKENEESLNMGDEVSEEILKALEAGNSVVRAEVAAGHSSYTLISVDVIQQTLNSVKWTPASYERKNSRAKYDLRNRKRERAKRTTVKTLNPVEAETQTVQPLKTMQSDADEMTKKEATTDPLEHESLDTTEIEEAVVNPENEFPKSKGTTEVLETHLEFESEEIMEMEINLTLANEVADTMETLLGAVESLENEPVEENLEASSNGKAMQSDAVAFGGMAGSDENSILFDVVISSVIQRALANFVGQLPPIPKRKSRRTTQIVTRSLNIVNVEAQAGETEMEKECDIATNSTLKTLVPLPNTSSKAVKTREKTFAVKAQIRKRRKIKEPVETERPDKLEADKILVTPVPEEPFNVSKDGKTLPDPKSVGEFMGNGAGTTLETSEVGAAILEPQTEEAPIDLDSILNSVIESAATRFDETQTVSNKNDVDAPVTKTEEPETAATPLPVESSEGYTLRLIPLQEEYLEGEELSSKIRKIMTSDVQLEDVTDALHNQCVFCTRSFRKKWQLLGHIDKIHGTKTRKADKRIALHRCTYCEKRFKSSKALKCHLQCHTGEKPYKCGFVGCGKAFTRSHSLKIHSLKHSFEISPQCQGDKRGEGPNLRQRISNAPKDNVVSGHHPERFKYKCRLKTPVRAHTRNRRCEEKFGDKHLLLEHLPAHSETAYGCEI